MSNGMVSNGVIKLTGLAKLWQMMLETMSQRTVKPELITSLSDWSKRWPKVGNLGFDPETREATVYSKDSARTVIKKIAWIREADTLTVLAQPQRFTAQAVASATRRYQKIREQRAQVLVIGEEELKSAEANLLEAWRSSDRSEIMAAERQMRELEASLANKDRRVIVENDSAAYYLQPMPLGRRGISLTTAEETA